MASTTQLRRGPQVPAATESRTAPKRRTAQKHVFWASYFGWLLDGFDTTIYAFVLTATRLPSS
jgi:hypothetical protein